MRTKCLLIVFATMLLFNSCSSDRPAPGIVNMRDLGGIEVADNRHVKSGLLIRAAHLADATQADLQRLAALPVAKVIDFRLEPEKQGREDQLIPGAEYISLPVDASGKAFEQGDAEAQKELTRHKQFDVKKIILFMAFNERAQQVAQQMYPTLLFSPACQQQYTQFFRELITTDSGAVFYHCTQGKDRTGISSALLLGALGADREAIIADFDASNITYEADVRKYSRRVRLFGGGEKELGVVQAFLGVNTANFIKALDRLESEYGSIDNYLKQVIGLTDEDLGILRQRYIE